MEDPNRMYAKVRALLAKAESTEYPEEAAVYTAKAQELITLHAIDSALLETREGRGQVVTRIIAVPSPYPKEKFILLGGIARANNCRAILGLERDTLDQMIADSAFLSPKGRMATVVGYESDLDAVEILFTSLLVQAVKEMLAHGSQVTEWGENRTRSFRRSFLYQFAWTVRERLEQTRERTRADAVETHGESVLPVLARREDSVLAEIEQRFPNTTKLRTSVSNFEGVSAGDAAGRRADIGLPRVRGTRAAIAK